jgi:hypothetical protein
LSRARALVAVGFIAALLLGLGVWRWAAPVPASSASATARSEPSGPAPASDPTTPAAVSAAVPVTSVADASDAASSPATLLAPGARVDVTSRVVAQLPFPVEGEVTATVVELQRNRELVVFRVEAFLARLVTTELRPPVYLTMPAGSTIRLTVADRLAKDPHTWSELVPGRTLAGRIRLSPSGGAAAMELISIGPSSRAP